MGGFYSISAKEFRTLWLVLSLDTGFIHGRVSGISLSIQTNSTEKYRQQGIIKEAGWQLQRPTMLSWIKCWKGAQIFWNLLRTSLDLDHRPWSSILLVSLWPTYSCLFKSLSMAMLGCHTTKWEVDLPYELLTSWKIKLRQLHNSPTTKSSYTLREQQGNTMASVLYSFHHYRQNHCSAKLWTVLIINYHWQQNKKSYWEHFIGSQGSEVWKISPFLRHQASANFKTPIFWDWKFAVVDGIRERHGSHN